MRAAVRQTRPTERLVRRSKAKAPAGFNRQRQWRLKTTRLVLPNDKPSPSAGVFRLEVWIFSARGRISAPMRQTTPIKIDDPHRYCGQALVIFREGAHSR